MDFLESREEGQRTCEGTYFGAGTENKDIFVGVMKRRTARQLRNS